MNDMWLVANLDFVDGLRTFRLEISEHEMQRASFAALDFRLMRECEGSDSVADKLLGLETIARRIEEATDATD